MPHMHARTGSVGQEVENVKLCNVLTRRETRRTGARTVARRGRYCARPRQPVDFNGAAMSRLPDEISFRQAVGNTPAVPHIVLCEVTVLAEQAFFAKPPATMKPTARCLTQQTGLSAPVSLKSGACPAGTFSAGRYRPWAQAERLLRARCPRRSARCAP